jgi:RNA-splicing ligase RtcB
MKNKNVKIFTNMIEDAAAAQIEKIADHPAFINAKIRIMPDVHAGKGCVCGFTADLGDKVVPNLVGVDIGCAVLVFKLAVKDIDFEKLDKVIREFIPSGQTVNASAEAPEELYKTVWKDADPRGCLAKIKDFTYVDRSVGSLGGGNHFIEIDKDKDGSFYLVIHCGSRNFGKQVCEYWQDVAIQRMAERANADEVTDADIDEILASI